MLLKKQTVWLLSMLTIMVVLSAYYLLQGPVEQVPVVTEMNNENAGAVPQVNVDTKQTAMGTEQMAGGTGQTAGGTGQASPNSTAMIPQGGSDYFLAYRMNRDEMYSKRLEELAAAMSSAQASAQEIAEAKEEYDQLAAMQTTVETVEDLIKANGYSEAVVVARDNKVDVIVQADQLSNAQAVEIISLVKRHMNVPGMNVVVSYKQ